MFPNASQPEPLPPATLPALPMQPAGAPGVAPGGMPGAVAGLPGAGMASGLPGAAVPGAVGLPGVPGVPGVGVPAGVPTGVSPAGLGRPAPATMPMPVQPGTTSAEQVIERAKQLVEQQGQNPYQFAESFAQLKSDYLARQYHITSNNSAGS